VCPQRSVTKPGFAKFNGEKIVGPTHDAPNSRSNCEAGRSRKGRIVCDSVVTIMLLASQSAATFPLTRGSRLLRLQFKVVPKNMKAALVFILFALGCVSILGQDPNAGLESNREMQRQQEALDRFDQRTAEQVQEFQKSMAQNGQPDTGPSIAVTCTPKFSVKAGKVSPGTKVSITCSTPGAVIYYNTNGWTPTTFSRQYKDPVSINASTNLQAFAVAPNMAHSFLAQAKYTLKGDAPKVFPLALSADGVLHAGARLHLVTSSAISSKTAKAGDKLNLLLDQDIEAGDTVVVPKGTPVDAVITKVTATQMLGSPGDLVFSVNSVTVRGKQIPLKGGETLTGASRVKTVATLFVAIPFAGAAGIAIHGHDAEIKPGMKLTAGVVSDTPLNP